MPLAMFFAKSHYEKGIFKMQVVLYANTRAEWMISAIGAFKHSLAIVTIYTNLGEDGVQHGITQVSFYPSLCFWLVPIMIQTNISTAVEDFIGS